MLRGCPPGYFLRSVLLFDDDVTLLLWMGRQVDPAVAAALQQRGVAVAAERAYYRFPRPTIRLLQEGSSMSRFLVCRLAPLHKVRERTRRRARDPYSDVPTLWLGRIRGRDGARRRTARRRRRSCPRSRCWTSRRTRG